MAALPTDYTDAVAPTGATTEFPATTARGINAFATEINTKISGSDSVSDLTALQSQVTVAGTVYYINGSAVALPADYAVGTKFRWTIAMAKTAAGTGAFNIHIKVGTAATVADTSVVTQSIGTQTAAVDNMMLDINARVVTTGATGTLYWAIIPTNKAATATGFGTPVGPTGQFSGTTGAVNLSTANLRVGIAFASVTGTPTITIPMCRANCYR